MGLDIHSKSDKEYHYSYRGLHVIRHLAYLSNGGKKDFGQFMSDQKDNSKLYIAARAKYPNLFWHSDCDGEYTLDGKVESFDSTALQTGNSLELLEELEEVKRVLNIKKPSTDVITEMTDRDAYIFYMLYDLVKDVVENHDGVLKFS